MTWKPHDGLIPSDVMHSAVEDTNKGRYEDALLKFLWFHEASRQERGMGGVRLSFALGYWMDLASRFPPAFDSFVALRDKMEARCRTNEGDFESFHDVFSLNQYLNADERTIDLFMQIAQSAPSNAKSLYHVVECLLISAGKYHACALYLEWQERVDTSISMYELRLEQEASREEDEVCPPKLVRRHFQNEIATVVALLVLNDRKGEAVKVCDRCLDILDDEEFRNTLRIALAGHFPTDEDGRTKR